MPVQLVLRPDQEFRGYAGQIASGTIRPGDSITAWPSGWTSKVARIVTWDGDLDLAHAPMSVTLVLEDELDISRGDLLAVGQIQVHRRFSGQYRVDGRAAARSRARLPVKHNTRMATAEVDRPLALNEIGTLTVTASQPFVFDPYAENRTTGSFVLIDPATNFTAGAGMILRPLRDDVGVGVGSAAERLALTARAAATDAEAIEAVRRLLEEVLV